jgi:glycosyltransferase involved in cell wall biosynthesis
LLVSNAFWANTGYGTQISQLALRLKAAGHKVALFANYGLGGSRTEWNGIPVYPTAIDPMGNDVIHGHAADWKADVVLILYDAFAFNGHILRRMPQYVCFWQPVDIEPLSKADAEQFRFSGAQPIAMSRFGERMLREGRDGQGFDPLYAPHGIDTDNLFVPPETITYGELGAVSRSQARDALREQEKLPKDAFLVGMNFHNKDAVRKATWEQMSAFAIFHHRHPDTLLMLHTMPHPVMSGHDLLGMADFLGIGKACRWADPYSLLSGNYTQEDMAKWYGRLAGRGVYSGASSGEGFGVPLIEAAACGVPVVATDASAMTELAGPGWLVSGQPHWHKDHQATWTVPDIGDLVAAYEEAYDDGDAALRSDAARDFSQLYNADTVFDKYWVPVLAQLGQMLTDGLPRDADSQGEWRKVK